MNYDAWKLSYPPWWDDPVELCDECEEDVDECACEDE
jgi:hypothetical protein